MQDRKEFGFYCPECDKQDFDRPIPDNRDEIDGFLGAKCKSCGHEVDDRDIDEFCWVIETYMNALINDETFH